MYATTEKGFLWRKTMSLWLSPKLAGENIQEAGQVFPSLTDTILQQSVLQSYAKFSLAGNTRLFQAHAVLVLCIYCELCSSAAPPNPLCSQQPSCCWGALAVTMLCNPDFTSQRPQGETCATDPAKGKFSTGRLPS